MTTWATTIESALALGPSHLSAYCYIPEDGTPRGDAVARGLELPGPEAQADLYEHLVARLEGRGLAGYETSNFAATGEECRHTLVYWLRRDSLPLGPSAHGLWRGVRSANHYAPDRWASELAAGRSGDSIEPETAASRADEIVMLGLRLACGVDPADHDASTWRDVTARYAGAFAAALSEGRLERCGQALRIPPAHRFLADDTIAWLMARAEPVDLTALEVAP